MALQPSGKALLDCNRATTSEDFWNELTKITVPTLVIRGDLAASVPSISPAGGRPSSYQAQRSGYTRGRRTGFS